MISGGLTEEDPRGLVDEDGAETFGIIGLETFDYEFYWWVVLR
jgi:hypothetical protein